MSPLPTRRDQHRAADQIAARQRAKIARDLPFLHRYELIALGETPAVRMALRRSGEIAKSMGVLLPESAT